MDAKKFKVDTTAQTAKCKLNPEHGIPCDCKVTYQDGYTEQFDTFMVSGKLEGSVQSCACFNGVKQSEIIVVALAAVELCERVAESL
jgi:hypothetical protein